MIRTWQIDEANIFKANIRALGRAFVTLNGRVVARDFNTRRKGELAFELSGGRRGALVARPQFVGRPQLSVTVDDQPVVENQKDPIKCTGCGKLLKPYDKFCPTCGDTAPTAATYVHRETVAKATRTIGWLGALFVVSGIVLFLVQRSQARKVLGQLAQMDPDSILPNRINGVIYTVRSLRHLVLWEQWSVLVSGLILGAVMAGLAVWGRRAPLPAMIIAAATYCVVVVTNAIIEPITLAQGLVLKIVVIALFYRGIKAALALRPAHA